MTLDATARTIAAARQILSEKFKQAGIDSAEADARLLIAHALGIDRAGLIADAERVLTAQETTAIDALSERLLKHEPVARIFGVKEFWSLSLNISEAVLVPRPETETVVEAALDFAVRSSLRMEALRILDIGTGSGALLLALMSELPHALGTGTDISAAALAIARDNAARHGFAPLCTFVQCNIAEGLTGPFDLIVSNPPYIARGDIATLEPAVRDYDPAVALDGGDDGLDCYRAIANAAPRLLAPGGRLIVELGAGQEPAVAKLFTKAGLTVAAARNDLAGIPRSLSARIEAETTLKAAS